MKQCTKLVCKETFSFKVTKQVTFKKGQEFWVTNTEVNQNNDKVVIVARKNQKIGYNFRPEQVEQLFEVKQ